MYEERFAVVGLGYVGLPVALGFARAFPGAVVGFDIHGHRIDRLRLGIDDTGEIPSQVLVATNIHFTCDPVDMAGATFFIVTVPTPIDGNRQPDLRPVLAACDTVGQMLRPGAVVVFESTVYPGVTEDICGPRLEHVSGLPRSAFRLGYSPERINPGDKAHTLETILKVVSAEDDATLERIARAYGQVVTAGTHRASSIQVAEAAKVIENTQRDINIALMNELALICDRLGIRTKDVLTAAATKWNFLPFSPGLVGGHCIGVDPYYLTAKAEALGYHPQVILAGRRINDGMGTFIAQKTVKLLIHSDFVVQRARIGILGLTFKENVPDLRNSRVPDILAELTQYRVETLVHDPMADPDQAQHEYGITLTSWENLRDLDAIIVAVPHRMYAARPVAELTAGVKPGGIVVDVKSMLDPASIPAGLVYWSL